MNSRFGALHIADPLHRLLLVRGYEPTNTTIASESFALGLKLAGKPDRHGCINYYKILDEARDDYHFVSLVSYGDSTDPANYYVVGVNMSVDDHSSYGGVTPNPPTIKLNDFLRHIGDQDPRAFLDNLPREFSADYSAMLTGKLSPSA